MCNALGIITYNDSSVYVEGMQKYRPIAAFSFLGRYRLVDFAISNMSNSGLDMLILIHVQSNVTVFITIGNTLGRFFFTAAWVLH